MIVQLIHNPASGTHNAARLGILSQAFEACGTQVMVGQTEIDGNLIIAPEADLICVSGGDGTLRLVIAAMVKGRTPLPLCVFPAGTVNLIAREIGYSSNPEQFAREVMSGYLAGEAGRLREPLAMSDAGPFVACLSAGPDGVAVATHSPKWKKRIGGMAYAISFAKLFIRWPRQKLELVIQPVTGSNLTLFCEAFYIAKGRHFAGSWTLSPQAGLGSKDFKLITLSGAGRWNFVKFIAQIATGRDPAKLRFVEHVTAQSVTITNSENLGESLAFQVDGDPMSGTPSHIRITDHVVEYCLPVRD